MLSQREPGRVRAERRSGRAIRRVGQSGREALKPFRVPQAVSAGAADLSSRTTRKMLADAMAMSQHAGQALQGRDRHDAGALIDNLLLEKARQLLVTTDDPIGVIAESWDSATSLFSGTFGSDSTNAQPVSQKTVYGWRMPPNNARCVSGEAWPAASVLI